MWELALIIVRVCIASRSKLMIDGNLKQFTKDLVVYCHHRRNAARVSHISWK